MISRRVLTDRIADQLHTGTDKDQVLNQLAAYIIIHKLTKQTDYIVSDIVAKLAERGTVLATITTAREMTDELRRTVSARVRELSGASQVELSEVIDERILGGIIIDTPTQRLDESVARQLKRLRNA